MTMTRRSEGLMTETTQKAGMTPRIAALRQSVWAAEPTVCPERALIWTNYFKKRSNRRKSAHVQIAEALRDVLLKKTIAIYPGELIVGNFSSKRVGGSVYPELSGVVVLEDVFRFPTRETSPLRISRKDTWSLLATIPFWAFRFVSFKAYKSPIKKLSFIADQLKAHSYIINESGGISHVAPDYERLIAIGADGIKQEAVACQARVPKGSDSWQFYEGVRIVCDALSEFGLRYAVLAERMAETDPDPDRRRELLSIAEVCRHVPRKGARDLHEAVQSLFFAQIAVNLESLDNSVCPGRMDHYLFPFYKKDVSSRTLTRQDAKELIAAFSIKMSEIVPIFSRRITRFHGGMFNGQVVTVGGRNRDGTDSTNELSYIFLEVMDELRMRQPNYHARIHRESPKRYRDTVYRILSAGSNSPALYNDDVIIETMTRHGYEIEDARDYTAVGCVEPVSQGKSFSSTDAAIFNVPLMLELALNEGRRFGSLVRSGIRTGPVSAMTSIDDVAAAFAAQLSYGLSRLIGDLGAVELANRRYHPTPLTSMLLSGCIESGTCSTAGGARYNFSGVQCVGPADVGDSLSAVERAVFVDKKLTLPQLVTHLKSDLADPRVRAYLRSLPKFGNDVDAVDRWTVWVVNTFTDILHQYTNTRGGAYVPGLYSVTAHDFFGRVTGALPNGRVMGEPFASGIAPANGMDRSGPTALINSVNRIDFTRIANGVNFNIKFDGSILTGERGHKLLGDILATYFNGGGMQIQTNVVDADLLRAAKKDPSAYPNLLVRVSGYSAYFHDLVPEMQDEIIERTCLLSRSGP
jgi:pyruvate formate-lyase/glycerol dehydratase family glycyl radical enzyme